jgi:hypothetical protein
MSNILQPHHGVRRLLASSAAFQTGCGVGSAAAALPFIVNTIDEKRALSFTSGVLAVVRMADGVQRRNIGIGNWKQTGSVYMLIERWYTAFPAESNGLPSIDVQAEQFSTWVSSIQFQMEALLDAGQLIMGQNPVAIEQFKWSDEPFLRSQESTPQSDPGATASANPPVNIWWVEADVELR